MRKRIIFSSIISFIILIQLCSAQCLDIQLSKSSYLSGETFQAEITATPITPLTYNDISVSFSGKEYFPALYLEQLAANKWIVYFDTIPKYGINDFSVRRIICRENDSLKESSKTVQFTVRKPLQEYFSSLMSAVKNSWSAYSAEEVARALIAIEKLDYDPGLLESGKNHLKTKIPSFVKPTALALKTVNDSNSMNWLADAQNSVSIGLWSLTTNSPTAKICNLSINSQRYEINIPAGPNSMDLDLPNDKTINISLDCEANAKISHTYLGQVNEFDLGIISNEKCWGVSYRSRCNATATAYALQIISDNDAKKWLSENAKTTEEIAYSYMLSGKSDLRTWLENNQHPAGYWSSSALAISNKPDVMSTIAAFKATRNPRAENWLRENLDSFTFEERAAALELFADKIEPLVSIKEGFLKVNSYENATLRFYNKGIFPADLELSTFSTISKISLPPKTTLPITFSVPKVDSLTFSSADLKCSYRGQERTYSIPLIVYSSQQERIGTNIVNKTVQETISKQANFQFIEKKINRTMNIGEILAVNLSIRNSAAHSTNVDFTIWGLSEILEDIPTSIDLPPSSITIFNVTFKANRAFVYSGQITAEADDGSSVSIPVYINVISTSSNKSCSDLKGSICKSGEFCSAAQIMASDGLCCMGECKKSGQASKGINWLGIVMIVLAIGIVVSFVIIKRKKEKRPGLQKVLDKLKEESRRPLFEEYNPAGKDLKDIK